jgi:hypothetical protein
VPIAEHVRTRVKEELRDLKRNIRRGVGIKMGDVQEGGQSYIGVTFSNVRISKEKFGMTNASLLFLLPNDYPRRPPIGCYLNFPYENQDHHFTENAYYGAPSVEKAGWYWYCVGLGGGFDALGWGGSWRPGRSVSDGHNFLTLYKTALYGINS